MLVLLIVGRVMRAGAMCDSGLILGSTQGFSVFCLVLGAAQRFLALEGIQLVHGYR